MIHKTGYFGWAREYGLPLALGFFSFLLVMGGKILVPTNTAWMDNRDPACYFLTWHFYRQTPWMWPLGANPNYGLDVGSSVFYGDAIPVLAIFFKIFSAVLPEPFQYWGFWLLGCFVLQAIFSWKLVGLLTSDRWIKALATGLFLFAPPFLFRFSCQYTLCAHWLLLAALYLCVGPKNLPRFYLWPALIGLTSGIHSYLLFMIVMLWIADATRRLFFDQCRLIPIILEGAAFSVLTLLVLWVSGFFMVHSGLDAQGQGLGTSRLSLISIFNPQSADFVGKWSYILPALPSGEFEFEGFAFPGLGLLLLGFICLGQKLFGGPGRTWRIPMQWIPLTLVLGFLVVFSFSNYIGVARHNFIVYPVPAFVGALRATGRLYWPAFYVALFLLVRFLIQNYKQRTVVWLLAAALVIQVVDTSSGWLVTRRQVNLVYGPWPTPLNSGFWDEASKRYQKVYLVPEMRWPIPDYKYFGWYATQHQMGTDAANLARMDPAKLAAHNEKIDSDLTSGHYDAAAIYILDKPHADMAARSLNPERDLLEEVDGYTILAPGWKKAL